MTASTIDPGRRVTVRLYDLLQLPKSERRDALIRKVTDRAATQEARDKAREKWVREQLAEAERHRQEAATSRGHTKTIRTAAELAWQEAQRKNQT